MQWFLLLKQCHNRKEIPSPQNSDLGLIDETFRKLQKENCFFLVSKNVLKSGGSAKQAY